MSDDGSRLAAGLAGRFAIERELGHGGMATVFLARDAKHGRLVALKVLRPELAAAIGVDRFLREIQIAARLGHPHIVPLHDSGEVDGRPYYVMPYVEGESLRQRLEREGPLAVDEAVRLTREVADALAYAHQQGVVHRDVKPENILLQAGHAVVTDFGIARAVTAAGGSELTHTGVAIGTPLYMSPEQVVGDPVDGRSDVYSLGCTLYEMLAGAPPYTGASSLAVLASKTVDPIPPLRSRRHDVPVDLEATIMKALAPAPADRFATAADLDRALGSGVPRRGPPRRRPAVWLTVLTAAVALAGTGYALLARRQPTAMSIAVLPLASPGGGQDDQIRSDGMTEALIDALSRVPGLRVASRLSVFAYQNSGLDTRTIGARLHAGVMLEGSYQRAESLLQVSVRLINAADGYVIWSDTYRRDPKDIFAVQDQISQAVVRALRVQLGGPARPLVSRPTENLDAYDLYLKGRWFWNLRATGPGPLHRAIGFFQQAIALDSNYAAAWAGLADGYSMLPAFGDTPPAEAYPEAKRAVQRALALDSTLPEAYTSLGIIDVFHDWDWPAAARAFDQALALDSTEPRTHLFHAWYYVAQGRLEDGLREVQAAQHLNPLSPITNARLGTAFYYLRRYGEAAVALQQALELDSTNYSAAAELCRVRIQQHRFPEALTLLRQPFDLQAAHLGGGTQGYALAMAGRRSEAIQMLRRLEQSTRTRYIDPEAPAMVELALGDTARALEWLNRGRDERSFYLPFLAADPLFAPLHRNAEFRQLVRTIGLVVPFDSTR